MSSKGQLIIVDEDADFAWLIDQLLSSEGWQVSAFAEVAMASAALETASPTASPSAVLLNLHIEQGAGFECLHRWHRSLSCPIVVLSALPSDAEQDKAQALGASAYLPKPFSYEQLRATLHRLGAGATS